MTRALRTVVAATAGILFLTSLTSPVPAHAQPRAQTPDSSQATEPKTKEQIEAQQHFQRAKDLYQTGSYREAIAELEAARVLDPKAKDLVFNLGIVHEKLGKFDEAITFFRQYEELESVTAAERAKAETIIKRIEGAKREVAEKPATTTSPAGPVSPQTRENAKRGRVDAATVTAGAVAVVGLGVGTVFGILAVTNRPSNFVTGRDGTYADLTAKTDDAHRQAVIADVALGVGIVAAAVTAYLYFTRTSDPTKTGLHPTGFPMLLGGSFR